MKIAAITDDGKTISQHFGRAPYYLVVTVTDGQVMDCELRDQLGHTEFANEPHALERPGQQHCMDSASDDKLVRMAEAIADCNVLLCRGMGTGAYESVKACKIVPVVTSIASIGEAVMAYLDGRMVDHAERLH